MYGFIPAQDATMVPPPGVESGLALGNICLSPTGIQAVVKARGNLTAAIDKL
ncbi:hypothetical protein [Pontibacter amylolyticus]|uniref:hypothetical protein n=1 Tax=Pontibacter amylolyticus TaxID=1424080 RepID=UPI001664A1CB|nr:hypothetical protein [Pontibacter amylolyticus]